MNSAKYPKFSVQHLMLSKVGVGSASLNSINPSCKGNVLAGYKNAPIRCKTLSRDYTLRAGMLRASSEAASWTGKRFGQTKPNQTEPMRPLTHLDKPDIELDSSESMVKCSQTSVTEWDLARGHNMQFWRCKCPLCQHLHP